MELSGRLWPVLEATGRLERIPSTATGGSATTVPRSFRQLQVLYSYLFILHILLEQLNLKPVFQFILMVPNSTDHAVKNCL